MRYALYFTPPREHPLTVAAAAWLGRDAFSGAPVPVADRCGLSPADHERLTAPPRRYYRITPLGRRVLREWSLAWIDTRDFVNSVLED